MIHLLERKSKMPAKNVSRLLLSLCLTAACALAQAAEPAAPPVDPMAPAAKPAKPPIFGSQLMTPQERSEYRTRMRGAKNLDEREQIRLDHHAAMKARAAERGVALPDAPPPRAGGMGPGGMGQGGGMGSGAGMGAGSRQ
jgi:hypothetical protein